MLDAGLWNNNGDNNKSMHTTRQGRLSLCHSCLKDLKWMLWLQHEQQRPVLYPTECALSWGRGNVCSCCLTCCLDEAGVVERLGGTAGLARGHLCSWKALQWWARSSSSWHSFHHSLHTQIQRCHFCPDLLIKEAEKAAQMSRHLKTKTAWCVCIPLNWFIPLASENITRTRRWLYMPDHLWNVFIFDQKHLVLILYL